MWGFFLLRGGGGGTPSIPWTLRGSESLEPESSEWMCLDKMAVELCGGRPTPMEGSYRLQVRPRYKVMFYWNKYTLWSFSLEINKVPRDKLAGNIKLKVGNGTRNLLLEEYLDRTRGFLMQAFLDLFSFCSIPDITLAGPMVGTSPLGGIWMIGR